VTTKAAERRGLSVTVTAKKSNLTELLDAVEAYLSSSSGETTSAPQ
jgi:hypothetical protein